ncbi:MAG: hypothetical protein LCH26_07255 [Proteobacteria bacterium]|nr:hypothetical protein [Pseudomonadota bacterium]
MSTSEREALERNERVVQGKLSELEAAEAKKAAQSNTGKTVDPQSAKGVNDRAFTLIGKSHTMAQAVRERAFRGILTDYEALAAKMSALNSEERRNLTQAREHIDEMKDLMSEPETTDLLARVLGTPSSAHTASSTSTQPSPEPTPMPTTTSTSSAAPASPESTPPTSPRGTTPVDTSATPSSTTPSVSPTPSSARAAPEGINSRPFVLSQRMGVVLAGNVSKETLERYVRSFEWWRASGRLSDSELGVFDANERAVRAKLAELEGGATEPTSHGTASPAPSSSQSVGGTPEPSTPTHTQSETHLPAPTPEGTRPSQSLGDLPRGTRAAGLQDSLDVLKDRPAPKEGSRRLPTRAGRRATQSALEENRAAQYEGQVTSLESLARVLPDASQAAATSQEPSQEEVRQVRESVENVEKVSSSLSPSQHSRLAAVKEKLAAYDEAHGSVSSTSSSSSAPSDSAAPTSSPIAKPKTPLMLEIEGGKELSSTQGRDAQRTAARAQRIAKVRERMGELGTLDQEGKEALKKEVRTLLSTASDSERAELERMQKTLNPMPAPRVQMPGSSTSSSSSTQEPAPQPKLPVGGRGVPMPSFNPGMLGGALGNLKKTSPASSSSPAQPSIEEDLTLLRTLGVRAGELNGISKGKVKNASAQYKDALNRITAAGRLEEVKNQAKALEIYLNPPAGQSMSHSQIQDARNSADEGSQTQNMTSSMIVPGPHGGTPTVPLPSQPSPSASSSTTSQVPSPHPVPTPAPTAQPSGVTPAAFSTNPVDGVNTSVLVSEAPVAPGSALLQVLASSAVTYKSRVSTPGGTMPSSLDRQPFLSRGIGFSGRGGLLPVTLFPGSRVPYGMGSVYGNLTQMQPSTPRFMPSDEGNGLDLDAGSDILDASTTTTSVAPPLDNTQPLVVPTAQRSSVEGQTDGGTTSFGGRFLGGLRSLASSWGIGSRQATQGDALTAQGGTPSVPGAARASSSFRSGDEGQLL